jgi:hypothetical protein
VWTGWRSSAVICRSWTRGGSGPRSSRCSGASVRQRRPWGSCPALPGMEPDGQARQVAHTGPVASQNPVEMQTTLDALPLCSWTTVETTPLSLHPKQPGDHQKLTTSVHLQSSPPSAEYHPHAVIAAGSRHHASLPCRAVVAIPHRAMRTRPASISRMLCRPVAIPHRAMRTWGAPRHFEAVG